MNHDTVFSPCRKYRYTLWRKVPVSFTFEPRACTGSVVMFIGLNPSTADEVKNDPTIRRCIDFASRWGFPHLCMCNLFGYRATEPRDMKAQPDPVGPENDHWICEVAKDAGLIVAAWGTLGTHLDRNRKVLGLLAGLGKPVHLLKRTAAGHPSHPLYLPADLEPRPL